MIQMFPSKRRRLFLRLAPGLALGSALGLSASAAATALPPVHSKPAPVVGVVGQDQLLATVTLPPLLPLPPGRSIAGGLYFPSHRVPSNFIGTSLPISQEHLTFWPDGKFYRGVLKGGLELFDFAAARQKEPSAWGVYSISGDKITFYFYLAGGKSETHDFRPVSGGFNLDGIFTSRQKSYRPGQRLTGHYDGGASVGSLTFAGDGTFAGSTIGALSANTDTNTAAAAGTVTGKSETADSGTYWLSGNTLTLRHKGGAVTRHTVYPYDLGGGKTAINVDGVMLHERRR